MSAIDEALAVLVGETEAPPTLETILCDEAWFGLTTASPLQRAICRWAEGLPVDHDQLARDLKELSKGYADDIAERMQLDWILGGPDVRVTERPELIAIDGGIRTGKSQLAAGAAAHRAITIPISSNIAPHEIIRDSTVSVDKDKAHAVLMHLRGLFDRNAQLSRAKRRDVSEGLDMERDTGHSIQLRVVHGGTAGRGLVSYWHLGATFDEASRMAGEDDAKVNLDDMMDAVEHRVLPGGQIWWISSPHSPMGPFYQLVEAWHGKPGRILVIKAPGPALNPVTWTPEECEKARARKRRGETDEKRGSFETDVLANWGTPESLMFPPSLLERVSRAGDLEPDERCSYYAYMDPATRGNAWTLVVGAKVPQADGSSKATQVLARDWTPQGAPLDPEVVLREAAEVLAPYDVEHVQTDQWAADAIISIGRRVGLRIMSVPWTASRRLDAYDSLRALCRTSAVELHEAVTPDLMQVRRRLTTSGATIVLPEQGGGRHCDFAPPCAAMALDCETWDEPRTLDPKPGDEDFAGWWHEQELKRMREAAVEQARAVVDEDLGVDGFGVETDEWNEEREDTPW